MALLDLSSDLSRFRSQVSGQAKDGPEASKATNNKNFATIQPITEKLSSFSPTINKTTPSKLESKLSSTKLDDVRKFAQENLLINSVSKYSSVNVNYNQETLSRISTEQVVSRFNKIQQKEFVSNFNKSNIVVLQPSGEKNNQSPTDIIVNKEDTSNNIQNPNIVITKPALSIDRKASSPNISIKKEDASDNIENPNIVINKIPLVFDRSKSSPKIYINKDESINNIQNPNIDILRKPLSVDRKNQTPNIITETIKEGLVVNPNTDVIRIENGTFHLDDESRLNPSGKPIRFVTESKLITKEISREKDTKRYDGLSEQLTDNSNLNLDTVIKTIPFGRNEDPDKSKFSISGVQQVNFFKDDNAKGFVVKALKGESQYKEGSSFSWKGKTPPSVNFITDVNAKGFQIRTPLNQTAYNTESSKFGFENAPEVNFFDVAKKYTSDGFKKFVTSLQSVYQPDSSQFVWNGKKNAAPKYNYFDIQNKNTTDGFHTFAQIYDTKYVPQSSQFDWDGNSSQSPESNYFDITGKNTTQGFHRFAQIYDTKYIPESSRFDWDGTRTSAPEVNYFDITGKNTTQGFHRFAGLYDTKYVPESSRFDWDGTRTSAPEVNYFDITGKNTTQGFHRFAELYDTKYVPESSRFDWDGKRQNAPYVDYFDITKKNTTVGFHTFAQKYDTKYVPESSDFDWDGTRTSAPEVNYFDISGKNTTQGFHRLAELYDTKYVPESSRFDWDGARTSAPEVNYFDISGKNTAKGFHRLAELYDTKYVRESSKFDWDGTRTSAPEVNYFDISGKNTTNGFHRLAELYDTKYVPESSRFDWDGKRTSAPKTNFFSNTHSSGFTTFVQKLNSEYKKESSELTFKGNLPTPVDFFTNEKSSGFINKMPALETKYRKDISNFTFKGTTPEPVNFFNDTQVDGFVIKTPKLETKYKTDISSFVFTGTRTSAPNVDYIQNISATGFTNFASALNTEYKEKSSRFTWLGSRQEAPAVNYFKILNSNPNAIEGFTPLFIDKTQTKYSDKLSLFSIESSTKKSPVRNVPYTTAFGYRPSERTGFMVGMSTFDGTLYPIIDPVLKFDATDSQRVTISTIRGENPASLKTNKLETYAPLSLGKRPWANGTLFSTLDSQIPNVKTKAPAGSYINKYERTMKDSTNKLGYLTKWAITRRSPSPLDDQYLKYKLQDESVNKEFAAFSQPYVVRGIQRRGEVENQRWGFGVNFDDGIVRGGAVTQAERILQDVFRIGKFTLSAKGLLFNVKQLGLQAMNPNVDKDPSTTATVLRFAIAGISPTQFYNPLTMIANLATARAGMHLSRHGLLPFQEDFLNRYEKATINRESSLDLSSREYKSFENVDDDSNRLIGLTKELLPMTFSPTMRQENAKSSSNLEKIKKLFDNLKKLVGKSKIDRLSSSVFGGAQSFLGIGGTTIRRASHPYLVSYNTAPDLFNNYTQPKYTEESKRETFYSATEPYSNTGDRVQQYSVKSSGELSRDIENLYQTLLITGSSPTNTVNRGILLQKGVVENIISKFSALEPKHQLQSDRYKASINIPTDKPISEGYHPDDANIADPLDKLKRYKVLSYGKLGKPSENTANRSRFFNDFRHDLELSGSESFITNPKIAKYHSRNLEDYFGLGKHGKPGAQRNIPFVSNVVYESSDKNINPLDPELKGKKLEEAKKFQRYSVPKLKDGQEFRGDRINIIDYKRANFNITRDFVYEKGDYSPQNLPGKNDLIDFYFTSLVLSGHNYCPAEVIVFRAIFDSISDNHKPSWNSVKYMGRADPLYVYQGYERSISFGFTVHIGSRDEMKATWRKLNYLASWTAPEYTPFGGFLRGPMCRINIGNLYRKMPGYISNLSYTFDNSNGYWETANLTEELSLKNGSQKNKNLSKPGVLQLPKIIQVSCEFVPIGMYRPEKNGVMYSLYDDEGNPENGLMPTHDSKTNYFKTFDNIGVSEDFNKYNLTVPPGTEKTPPAGNFESDPEEIPRSPLGDITKLNGGLTPPASNTPNNFVEIR